MKKLKINLTLLIAIMAGLFITSCSDDDDNSIEPIDPTDETGGGGNPTEDLILEGSLEEDRTLDPSQTYSLDGVFSVESGVTLTIPAGTEIVAESADPDADATSIYIVVQRGGQIDIQGTESNPVVMRSNGQAGSWGGLVIAGNATSSDGTDLQAEVGGIIYGGTQDNDDSGSINYLILSDAGASINSESQYNGLSLYAVGSETSIQNVAIINGADDGVEFFGGTVSASNLYLENNEDDAVDWTEGWNGSIDNVYVLHTIGNFSTAIEADGPNGDPQISNFTAVSTTGGTALQFKSVSGATITGLSLSGYETFVDIADDTRTDLTTIQIEGEDADLTANYSNDPTVDVQDFAWVTERNTSVSVLPGQIDSDMTLDSNVEYVISSVVSVNNGSTLTIPAGTKVTARSDSETAATSIYVVVQRGGMIDIQGTENNPVVMSSTSGQAGSWGGLVIAGNATSSDGTDLQAEVGGIAYGGTQDDDNSGSIQYLILKDAGASINSESQYNGLSLYAVGSGTTIENVAIINGADDGVEFFGGTVSASKLYLENNEDDAVDWTEGWSGSVTDVYVSHTIGNFSTAIEADGPNGNPQITNFTAVSTTGGTALQFKSVSGATITGLSLSGYETNIDIADDTRTDLDGIQIEGVVVDLDAAYDADATVDVAMFDWAM